MPYARLAALPPPPCGERLGEGGFLSPRNDSFPKAKAVLSYPYAPVGAGSFQGRMRQGRASPERSGLSDASPKAKLSGGVQLSFFKVIFPWLRDKL